MFTNYFSISRQIQHLINFIASLNGMIKNGLIENYEKIFEEELFFDIACIRKSYSKHFSSSKVYRI